MQYHVCQVCKMDHDTPRLCMEERLNRGFMRICRVRINKIWPPNRKLHAVNTGFRRLSDITVLGGVVAWL